MSWSDVTRENTSNDKIPYTKFEVGNTMIRILDNEPYSFWNHWLQKQQTSIVCPNKDCPICNVIRQAKANKTEVPYNSSQRHAVRIWNYTTNQMEIMIQGRTFFSNLLDLHKEVGDITSYDIKVIRKGNGTDTTYTLLPQRPETFTITDGVQEVDMADVFAPPTHDEILMLMEGKTWAEINGVDDTAA